MTKFDSWGRLPRPNKQDAVTLAWRDAQLALPVDATNTALPYGLGRSYGDSCLNDGHTLLLTRGLDRFISFDKISGLLTCEAGTSLGEILALIVPQGWFLPVTPGTKFVTVGGAVANDVHGKNHHCDGTFAHSLRRFELLRSDGSRLICSNIENVDLFLATIGGLGLTGLITWAEFQLRPVANAAITQEVIKFGNLEEFFALSSESERDYAYTVSWIDCLAQKSSLGRGLFIRGNHAAADIGSPPEASSRKSRVPFDLPAGTINPWSVRAFNFAYYHKQRQPRVTSTVHYDPFFYPLDAVNEWNRIYGKPGFYQYQCVVPFSEGTAAIREILTEIAKAGLGSFLAVLKTFGSRPSLGMLSFARPGVTLALDFPNTGENVLRLFERLDAITLSARGSVYPAKDARMSGLSFKHFFPRWEEFSKYVDPRFSSSFWRRVMESP